MVRFAAFRMDIHGVTPYNFFFHNKKPEALLIWYHYFPPDWGIEAEISDKICPLPYFAVSISSLMTLSLSLCNCHGISCPSTNQSTFTVPPQLYPYHHDFYFFSILFDLYHCIFPCITSTVSVPIPPTLYPFHHFLWHYNHYCISNSSVSIALFILCYIYHKIHHYDAIPIIISST